MAQQVDARLKKTHASLKACVAQYNKARDAFSSGTKPPVASVEAFRDLDGPFYQAWQVWSVTSPRSTHVPEDVLVNFRKMKRAEEEIVFLKHECSRFFAWCSIRFASLEKDTEHTVPLAVSSDVLELLQAVKTQFSKCSVSWVREIVPNLASMINGGSGAEDDSSSSFTDSDGFYDASIPDSACDVASDL